MNKGNILVALVLAFALIPLCVATGQTLNPGPFEIAFQANTGVLWTAGAQGTGPRNLEMMSGTSPSVAALGGNGYVIAYHANNTYSTLCITGTLGTTDLGWGMAAGTSPSIMAVPGSKKGYEIAFQANTGELWVAGTLSTGSLGLRMMPGTSPSIISVNGGYQIAFQSDTGELCVAGALGTGPLGLWVAPGSSPSIIAISGGYQIAYHANNTYSTLCVTGTLGTADFGLGMASGTSPSITALPRQQGYEIAIQANTGELWVAGTLGTTPLGLFLAPGTSPSIAALMGGGYEIAYLADNAYKTLCVTGTLGTVDLGWGMMQGTSPGIFPVEASLWISPASQTINTNGSSGQNVTFEIHMNTNIITSGFGLNVTYPSNMFTVTSVTPMASGLNLAYNTNTAGTITIASFNSNGNQTGSDIALIRITLTTKRNASGTASIGLAVPILVDISTYSINASATGGKITLRNKN